MAIKIHPWKGRAEAWQVDIRMKVPGMQQPYRKRVVLEPMKRRQALAWAEQHMTEVLARGAGAAAPKPKVVPTLAEFWPRFIKGYSEANNEKPSTKRTRASVWDARLKAYLGERRLDEITTERVQNIKADMIGEELSGSYVNTVLNNIGACLRCAVDWGVLAALPCKIKLAKVSQADVAFWDFDEHARMLAAAKQLGDRAELLILLGCDAGLRVGEIIALEWTDLDFTRRQIHVRRSDYLGEVSTPKAGRTRRVPMTDALRAKLLAMRHLASPRVLYREVLGRCVPDTREVMSWLMQRVERKAGVPPRGGLHVMRHSFCSHLAMRGATAKAIQELAGHRSLTTTQRYMHLSPAHRDEAVALLNSRPAPEAGNGLATEAGVSKSADKMAR